MDLLNTSFMGILSIQVYIVKLLCCAIHTTINKTNATVTILLSIIPFITSGRRANESCTASIIMLLCLYSAIAHSVSHLTPTLGRPTMLCKNEYEQKKQQEG